MTTERKTEHLQIPQLPGVITPLKKYEVGSKQPKDSYEALLSITFCKGYLPPIRQHLVIEDIARGISNEAIIVGVGDIGREIAKLDSYTVKMDNDGKPSSHGLTDNDRDVVVLSPLTIKEFQSAFEQRSQEAIQQIFSTEPGIAHMCAMRTRWSNSSLWKIPPYLKIQVNHGKPGIYCETLHIHHQQINGGRTISELSRDYQPWYSTHFGAPLFLGFPNDQNEFDHYSWNPTSPESGKHYVRVCSPEIFAETSRSILQITRIALGVIQAGIVTEKPAEIHQEDLELMRKAVEIHTGNLTGQMRASAERRLATIMHRARTLEYFALGPGSTQEFMYKNSGLPYPVAQIQEILDQVNWGETVLGISVKKYLEENQLTN